MNYKIIFHQAAIKELDEALSWYKKEKHGLEKLFYKEYFYVESRISENPLQFPKVLNSIRRANLAKFPYSIFFDTKDREIFILAIFHNNKNPERWKSR